MIRRVLLWTIIPVLCRKTAGLRTRVAVLGGDVTQAD
jgi:hypothetical protein